jgi:CRISPR-associated protein Cas2
MTTPKKYNWLLCYDISDPKRLGRIHRYVTRVAIPLQYSVFQLQASHQQLDSIIEELRVIMNEKEDDIRIYPLHKIPKKYTMGDSLFPEGIMLFNNSTDLLQ